MVAPLSSIAVANWFIDKAKSQGMPITAMKLQKLMFYAHGWCLVLYDKPLINEQVEAWKFGPVFSNLYHEAKFYGSQPITSLLESSLFSDVPNVASTDPRIPLLDKIWDVYGKFSAYQLSSMTHEKGSPWEITYTKDPDKKGTDIPVDIIKAYFTKQLRPT